MEFDNVIAYSTSFEFFKYSSLYLRKYLEDLYNVSDIEEFERSVPAIPNELTRKQKSFMLTTTMLVNRIFTLVDSYFESLSFEMAIVSDALTYQPFDRNLRMSTRALKQTNSSHELILNRLKFHREDYKFNYLEEDCELIDTYFHYYEHVRNPNTHSGSGITTFGYMQRLLLLSLATIDMRFYYSWKDNNRIINNYNLKMYNYFLKMSKLTIPRGWDIIRRNNINDLISDYQGMLSEYSFVEIAEFETQYRQLFQFIGGEQLGIMFL